MTAPLPLTVLTGFLGAGKTTLLGRLLHMPAFAGAAVIVNELGEVSLDHDLVETADETVVQLKGGCLCCAVREDLAEAVAALFERRRSGTVPRFGRVLLETTGLADLAPILQTLLTDPALADHVDLQLVVTLVDAANGAATLGRHEEAVRQVAAADRLLVTKADIAADPDGVEAAIRRINPAALLARAVAGAVDPGFLLPPPGAAPAARDLAPWLAVPAAGGTAHGGSGQSHDIDRHDRRVRAWSIVRDAPVPADALALFLETLGRFRGPDLLRLKGLVRIAERPERPALVQAVQHVLHPLRWLDAWPGDDRRTRLVFIARDMPPEQVEEMFDAIAAGFD